MSNFISTEGPAIITLILKLLFFFFFKFEEVSRILGVKWYNRTQEGLCEKKDADNGRSETRKNMKLNGRRRIQQGLG